MQLNTKNIYFYILMSTTLVNSTFAKSVDSFKENLIQIENDFLSGKYSEVISSTSKILQSDLSNNNMADLYLLANFRLHNYKSIINLYPENKLYLLNTSTQLKVRALALYNEKNYPLALRSLDILKKTIPLDLNWRTFYHYLAFKINPKNSFGELDRLNKHTADPLNNIISGKLYLLSGKKKEALISFQAAFDKSSLDVEDMKHLSEAYVRNKLFVKSEEILKLLLKDSPNDSGVKIKLAQNYIHQSRFNDAIEMLENDNSVEVFLIRERIANLVKQYLNNGNYRAIAEEKKELLAVSSKNERAILEDSFVPNEIDIYIDSSKPILNVPPKINEVEIVKVNPLVDVSSFEFTLGPKMKRFNLSGLGFNASFDYSTGVEFNIKHTFSPAERFWNSQMNISHSSTTFSNLVGLSSNRINFAETRAILGINYLKNSFSLGPFLMFERMSATQVTPSTLRGNADSFFGGLKIEFFKNINSQFRINLDTNFATKLVTASKTSSTGNFKSRSLININGKLYYRLNPNMFYFVGIGHSISTTNYESSSARGTSNAIELEKDYSFPLGIKYDY